MKVKAKRLISLVCALAMCAALVPATVLADDNISGSNNLPETSAQDVSINKTATELDENLESTVTLDVGATEQIVEADVVFVLDKSTSVNVKNSAIAMLDELMTYSSTHSLKVNVGLVTFNKIANNSEYNMDLAPLNDDSKQKLQEIFNKKLESGTNIEAGIRAGMEMLANDKDVPAENKHLVLVTDGVSYLWGTPDEEPKTVYIQFPHTDGSNLIWSSPSIAAGITDKNYLLITQENYLETFSNAAAWMQTNAEGIEEFISQYETVYGDDSKYMPYAPEESNHYSFHDAALYRAALAWKDAAAAGYNLYAYASEKYRLYPDQINIEGSYPWASDFIGSFDTIAGTSDMFDDSDTTYVEGMFDNVSNGVLYTINSGTITDVIGNDFDLSGLDTFTLTVGNQKMYPVVDEEAKTVKFYASEEASVSPDATPSYVVTYDPDNAEGEQFTFDIEVPVEKTNPLNLSYKVKLVNVESKAGKYTVPTNEEATLAYTSTNGGSKTAEFPKPTVSYYVASIQPADITIYMGGDNGYEGVAEDTGKITGSNSLPEPGYYITLPDEINKALNSGDTAIDLSDHLTISTHGAGTNQLWNLTSYGKSYSIARNKYIYALVPQNGSSSFRLNFVAGDQTYTSDTFEPAAAGALHETYTMEVYPELVDNHQVTINVTKDDQTYTCIMSADTGTLDIRYVTGDQDSVVTPAYNDIASASKADDPTKDALDKAYVIRDTDTKFYINSSSVDVSEEEGFADVSLLFDDIISSDNTDGVTDYSAAITDKAIETAAKDFQNVKSEAKYLDLVDANNGNVWLTPSKPVTVYWPYPDGTDANTTFKLVHFVGLDRDMSVSDVESNIANAKVEVLDVKTDKYGISFTTDSFSPFVLLWDNTQTTTVTTTVNPTPTPTPDEHPDIAEAKANGTWGQPTPTPAAASVVPQTSDGMPVTLLAVLASAAAVAMIVLVVVRKRRRDQ